MNWPEQAPETALKRHAVAGNAGKKQSELIREAVDRYIELTNRHRLREAAGV